MSQLRGGGEKLLAWFYSGGAVGVLGGGKSSCGGMLERAALFRVGNMQVADESAITAWPHPRRYETTSWTPDEEQILRLGRAARELRRVRDRDPFALEILEALFSDSAMRWARTKHGRVAALVPLTATGRKLLAKARTRQRAATLKLDDAKLAENLVQAPSADITRAALIRRALDEAEQLEAYAVAIYNGDDVPRLGVASEAAE